MINFKEKMLKCGFTDYYPAQTNRVETVDRPFHTRFSSTYVVKVENFDVDDRDEIHITYGIFTGMYQCDRPLSIKNSVSISLYPDGRMSFYKMNDYKFIPYFIKYFLSESIILGTIDIWENVMLSVIQIWMKDHKLTPKDIQIVE